MNECRCFSLDYPSWIKHILLLSLNAFLSTFTSFYLYSVNMVWTCAGVKFSLVQVFCALSNSHTYTHFEQARKRMQWKREGHHQPLRPKSWSRIGFQHFNWKSWFDSAILGGDNLQTINDFEIHRISTKFPIQWCCTNFKYFWYIFD